MAVIDDFEDEEERKRRSAAGTPEFTYETIQADPWSAVYFGIPRTADAALLRHAYDATMQCCGSSIGPGGAAEVTELNFERAVRRLDEVGYRLRPVPLDDEAARQAPEQEPSAEIAPQWRQADNNWEMVVGERTVAALIPISDAQFPQYNWLSFIVSDDYPEHGWHAVDFGTLADGQHVLEQWWHHARKGEAYRPEVHDKEPIAVEEGQQNDREPMTIEAIERNSWNAVALDLPPDASRELLTLVATTADRFRETLLANGHEAATQESHGDWSDYEAADARCDEAWLELQRRDMREAAAAPEFSRQTIAADWWTTVYLPIPEGADPALLAHARQVTGWVREGLEFAGPDAGGVYEPSVIGSEYSRAENIEHANTRIAELDERLELTRAQEVAAEKDHIQEELLEHEPLESALRKRDDFALGAIFDALDTARPPPASGKEPMTAEAIARDPWNAVDLDIPPDASRDLLSLVAKTADTVRENLLAGGHEAELHGSVVDWSNFQQAAARYNEAWDKLDALESGRAAAQPQSRDAGDELSQPLGAAELAERVRRIMENPFLADAERDDRVLQAVEERREELSQAEAARQDDAPQVGYSQEPELQSSADRDAAEIDYLFGRQEMTEARAAAYDRFTGQELSPRDGQSTTPNS